MTGHENGEDRRDLLRSGRRTLLLRPPPSSPSMKRKSMDELEPSNSKFHSREWSELPQELLEIIAAHLTFGDHVRFAAVCTSWRLVAIGTRHHNALRLPWMLHFDSGRNFSAASSPEDVNELNPIIPIRGNCLGCCEGWMVMANTTSSGKLRLINPLSGHCVFLPDRIIYPEATRDIGSYTFNKAVISSSPLYDTCVVVARLSMKLKLAFCRPFDDAWVLFPSGQQPLSTEFVEDINFHQGLFYSISIQCQIVVYRFSNNPQQQDLVPVVVRIYSANLTWDRIASRRYLVLSAEKLFVAARYYRWENNECMRLMFNVFVLDLEREEWMKVKSLDENVFFLADKCSRSYKIDHNSSSGGYYVGHIYYIGDGIYDVFDLEEWGPLVPQSLISSRDTTSRRSWFVLN